MCYFDMARLALSHSAIYQINELNYRCISFIIKYCYGHLWPGSERLNEFRYISLIARDSRGVANI